MIISTRMIPSHIRSVLYGASDVAAICLRARHRSRHVNTSHAVPTRSYSVTSSIPLPHVLTPSMRHVNITTSTSSSRQRTRLHDGVTLWMVAAGGVALGVALVVHADQHDHVAYCAAETPLQEARRIAASPTAAQPPAGGWPLYTAADVAAHATADTRIWVSFRDGVYDITDFVNQHPGGSSKVMLGAGGPIDPFWSIYRQHDHESVRALLAQFRIGTLADYQQRAVSDDAAADPYAEDPHRHRSLVVRSRAPFNGEPPLEVLGEQYITPNELFFVRNHLPVPHIDTHEYRLHVGGEGMRSGEYSLDALRSAYPHHSLTSTIQCAGNRRSDMNRVKSVKGLDWGCGAISTAQWGGVRLRDVLSAHGVSPATVAHNNVQHVHFYGLDQDALGMRYSASIPIDKVFDGSSDVLLAYEMNGDDLPLDHGRPLRAIIPGVVGARNVKWLGEVRTSAAECTGHWQQNDYKGFSPNIDWNNVDFNTSPAIQELPVTSAITSPAPGTLVPTHLVCRPATTTGATSSSSSASSSSAPSVCEEYVDVKGYAWSGGGRGIVRVDVSADHGATWHTARLQPKPATEPQGLNRSWAWTLWTARVPVSLTTSSSSSSASSSDGASASSSDGQPVTLICKAVDSSYNSQPEHAAPIWNLRGCLSNSWHRVPVRVVAGSDVKRAAVATQARQ